MDGSEDIVERLMEPIDEIRALQPGDHLVCTKEGSPSHQHGLYLGFDKGVMQVAQDVPVQGHSGFKLEDINQFTCTWKDSLFRVIYVLDKIRSTVEVLQEAEALLNGRKRFKDLGPDDIDRFMYYMKTGLELSHQVLYVARKAVEVGGKAAASSSAASGSMASSGNVAASSGKCCLQ